MRQDVWGEQPRQPKHSQLHTTVKRISGWTVDENTNSSSKSNLQKQNGHTFFVNRGNVFLTSKVGGRKPKEWSRRLSTLSRSSLSPTSSRPPPLRSSSTSSLSRTPPSQSSWTRGALRWSATIWTQTTLRGAYYIFEKVKIEQELENMLFRDRVYETPHSLLDNLSPGYRQAISCTIPIREDFPGKKWWLSEIAQINNLTGCSFFSGRQKQRFSTL